jgi:hypothetical protein
MNIKLIIVAITVICLGGDNLATAANLQKNGNGTVTDNSTGLVWQQGENGMMSWESAAEYCQEKVNLGGKNDWRLPNYEELRSIVDYTKMNPAVDISYFPKAKSWYYWSTSTFTNNENKAWIVDFTNGTVNRFKKGNTFNVRCVRGEKRFVR